MGGTRLTTTTPATTKGHTVQEEEEGALVTSL